MFLFKEILESIKNHKSKSIIAGITVVWGLIMLILLVSTGQGLQKGVQKLFSDYTVKTIEVFGGEVSISDLSVSKGDIISFTNQDLNLLSKSFNEIENISPVLSVNVTDISSYYKTSKRFSIYGVNEQYFNIKKNKLKEGRYFNSYDSEEKVLIIGQKIAENLFNNSRCLGQLIFINDIGYTVIGVLEKGNLFSNQTSTIFMPFNRAINYENTLNFYDFIINVTDKTNIIEFNKMLKSYLAILKGFNKKDKHAIMFNTVEDSLKTFNTLFKSINLFLWFISISFLISGMLGIFNVMTIIVKDRIGEFGIRKAVGATPKSIQKMVLIEVLIITTSSGIIGLISGYFIIILVNLYITIKSNQEPFMILQINLPVILGALVLLVVSGIIAGIVPARKASNIVPVEALRQLNN
ncbi:MAG TPA: FtsX-like permease family protein [Bacteroidia bacterium]|nr:FtsX-like permease family protein [Bacteroidia bacterium]